jgi:lauroyl/myristoyl acyltransferase
VGTGWSSFYFVRACERLLPPGVLSVLLWPLAALWDLIQLRGRKPLVHSRRFPRSWPAKRWRFILKQSVGLYHSQLFYMWPDRLTEPRWQKRCRFEGDPDLLRTGKDDRPIVLASLHFGPFEILPYWLRAYGIPATSVRTAPPAALRNLTNYHYSLSPPPDVPLWVFAEELTPLPRFSHIRKILGPGRRLLVLVDPNRGLMADVPFDGGIFRMATGAVRLAQMADAKLVPCLISEDSAWRFTIHIGEPVPQEWLGRSVDMQKIGTHLIGEFSKVVRRYPEQCKMRCLQAMRPGSNGASETSAVPVKTAA